MRLLRGALALVLCGGTAYAAESALPGDILYPVKLHVDETVQGAFAVTDAEKRADGGITDNFGLAGLVVAREAADAPHAPSTVLVSAPSDAALDAEPVGRWAFSRLELRDLPRYVMASTAR